MLSSSFTDELHLVAHLVGGEYPNVGNEDGTARLLTSPLPQLKKVNARTENTDFCANVTAHIWILTVGGV